MNKNDLYLEKLHVLSLSKHEATIYMQLLQKPATHAQLSLATGINRTTLYRLVATLEKRGLVVPCLDDRGKYLRAADPSTLESDIVTQEEHAKRQRAVFSQLLPELQGIKKGYEADFAIHSYDGTEGFKRMLWHELKTKGDCLCISIGSMSDLVLDNRWAEKHRQMTTEAGYIIREIVNPGAPLAGDFTKNTLFASKHFQQKIVPRAVLPINHLITIYNHTVATYNVFQGRRMGLEIVSKTYAETMRCVFEMYWQLGNND